MNISKKTYFSRIKNIDIIPNILSYIDNENFKYKLVNYSKKYQRILKINLFDYKKKYFEKKYLELNKNLNNFNQCLMKIKDNENLFKNNTHSFIFCYLLGYYFKNNININDFNNIINNYQNCSFSLNDFFIDFKIISKIFFDYFINSSLNQNNFNNNKIKQINNIQKDYEIAKKLEEQDLILLQIKEEQENSKQIKKCEICLENFSLLDATNYFLNCNCVLHYKCFDEMVKNAVKNNSLPVKCPNCGTPIHPNFIEDSLRNANPQLFGKYDKYSMNNFLLNNIDNYSSCPTPGCEYLFFFNPGEYDFLCPWCNKRYCLNCKDEWHNGLTCQEYKDSRNEKKLDAQFLSFVKGAKFKVCPKCKYWVEKSHGCNHMRCRCGADFCYICGKFTDKNGGHYCKK